MPLLTMGTGSDWLTITAGGAGVSSARSTMSDDARTSSARGVVRGNARACITGDSGSSSSKVPQRTSSASELSFGQGLYGEPAAALGETVPTRSPRLGVVIMYGRARSAWASEGFWVLRDAG